jgi:large subunit ribosomal protein L9
MLYGSVTSMDIQEALKEKGYEFDRRKITLPEAIKETGEFTVKVRLHREVNVEIPVVVTAEGGAPATAAAATSADTAPEATAETSPVDATADASGDEAGDDGE